jgi:hypothetical protein
MIVFPLSHFAYSSQGGGGCTPIQGLTFSSAAGTSNFSEAPAYGLYDYGMSMFLINQSEFGSGEKQLKSIAFETGGGSGYVFNNQRVRLAHTTATNLTTSIQILTGADVSNPATFTGVNNSDLMTVKDIFNWTIGSSGWQTPLTFDENFCYNGVDNLLVIWENIDGAWSGGYPWYESWFSNTNTETWYKYQDNSFPTGYGTTNVSYRPNMRFEY